MFDQKCEYPAEPRGSVAIVSAFASTAIQTKQNSKQHGHHLQTTLHPHVCVCVCCCDYGRRYKCPIEAKCNIVVAHTDHGCATFIATQAMRFHIPNDLKFRELAVGTERARNVNWLKRAHG